MGAKEVTEASLEKKNRILQLKLTEEQKKRACVLTEVCPCAGQVFECTTYDNEFTFTKIINR